MVSSHLGDSFLGTRVHASEETSRMFVEANDQRSPNAERGVGVDRFSAVLSGSKIAAAALPTCIVELIVKMIRER